MRKSSLSVVAIAILAVMLIGCSKVPAGYRGVKVYLLGKSKGVDSEVLGIGRYYIGVNEDLFLFPVFMQNVRWTESITDFSPKDEAIRFQDRNNMTITADIGFSYTIDEKAVPQIFQRHRKGIEEITDVYLRNIISSSFGVVGSKLEFTEMNGPAKREFLKAVTDEINTRLEGEGFSVAHVTILDMRPPEDVKNAIVAKMKAQQDAERAKAEAEATTTKAAAEAKSIRMRAESITPALVEYEKIQVQKIMAGRWNGVQSLVSGGSSWISLDSDTVQMYQQTTKHKK